MSNPDPTYRDGDADASPKLRSIFERMTNPTPNDLTGSERLKGLGPGEVEKVVELMITYLEHLAKQRPGMSVVGIRDPRGWTVRIDHGY